MAALPLILPFETEKVTETRVLPIRNGGQKDLHTQEPYQALLSNRNTMISQPTS